MILFFSEHPNCRAMCGSCVGHVWVMSGSCLGHVWVTSGSCLGHVCVMSESCLGHVCVMSGSCLGHVWVMSASCVGHVWVMSGSCLGHVWVMSGSRLGHVCVMSGPPIVKTQHLGARGGSGRPADPIFSRPQWKTTPLHARGNHDFPGWPKRAPGFRPGFASGAGKKPATCP